MAGSHDNLEKNVNVVTVKELISEATHQGVQRMLKNLRYNPLHGLRLQYKECQGEDIYRVWSMTTSTLNANKRMNQSLPGI